MKALAQYISIVLHIFKNLYSNNHLRLYYYCAVSVDLPIIVVAYLDSKTDLWGSGARRVAEALKRFGVPNVKGGYWEKESPVLEKY